MDISSTYLTSLLKEALTPQPVPSPKADPATTALIKAIVQPPAPSTVPSAQFAAQALNGSLPRSPAQAAQRLFSGEIEDAYRAVIEPDAATDGAPARSPVARAADADQASRGVAPPQPAPADSAPRIAAAPSLPVSVTAAQAAMFAAANSNTKQRGGRPGTRPGNAPQSEPRQPALWVVSIATALISAAVTTFVLMMIR